MSQPDPGLLAEYLREPRRTRRAISRDLARAYPVPPRQPGHGRVAAAVHAPRRAAGRTAHTSAAVPASGRARRDAKRNRRALFWAEQAPVQSLARQLRITPAEAARVPAHLRALLLATPAI